MIAVSRRSEVPPQRGTMVSRYSRLARNWRGQGSGLIRVQGRNFEFKVHKYEPDSSGYIFDSGERCFLNVSCAIAAPRCFSPSDAMEVTRILTLLRWLLMLSGVLFGVRRHAPGLFHACSLQRQG